MGVNKVDLSTGETLIDISNDTVSEEVLVQGYTAHNSEGEEVVGTLLAGDMLKNEYDKDSNGQVDKADDSDRLGGQLPSYYATQEQLNSKADLVDGKVPKEQLPDDIGGGSPSGGIYWEDIVDRPFGSTINNVTILESQSAVMADLTESFDLPLYGFFGVLENATMTEESFYNNIQASYDETIYNLTKAYSADVGVYYFGNGSLLNVLGVNIEDTGEPFVIGLSPDGNTVNGYLFITGDTQETTHTVAIAAENEIIKTLDIKFLPKNMALGYESKSFEDIVWDGNTDGLSVISQGVDMEGALLDVSYVKVSDVVIDKELVLDGECLGWDSGNDDLIKITSDSILNKTESGSYWIDYYLANVAVDNDSMVMPDFGLVFTFPETGIWVLSAKAGGETVVRFKHLKSDYAIVTIDEKFIPDTIARKSDIDAFALSLSNAIGSGVLE